MQDVCTVPSASHPVSLYVLPLRGDDAKLLESLSSSDAVSKMCKMTTVFFIRI
jgi:hypothetical protein